MELLQILVFSAAAVVNYFNSRAALWITLAGLLLPALVHMAIK